jgi:predicted TIM-barrel fold metal-dependent hydrolase
MRTLGEVRWVEGIAGKRDNGQPGGSVDVAAAIIGHVDLCLGSRIEQALDAMKAASSKRFRGIRHTVRHQSFPGIFNRVDRAGLLLEPDFRTAARVIARKGLTLEGCLYFLQIPELVDLLRAIPELTFIANHFAGPLMVGPYAERADDVYEEWRRNVAELGKCPNAIMKLGGVGTHFPRDVGVDWRQRDVPIGSGEVAEVIAPWVHHCIDHFGPDRCMFESNFPGDKMCVSYRVLYNAFKRVSARYSPDERADLFHDTAMRVYRIGQ